MVGIRGNDGAVKAAIAEPSIDGIAHSNGLMRANNIAATVFNNGIAAL